jgi:hypothetical protein
VASAEFPSDRTSLGCHLLFDERLFGAHLQALISAAAAVEVRAACEERNAEAVMAAVAAAHKLADKDKTIVGERLERQRAKDAADREIKRLGAFTDWVYANRSRIGFHWVYANRSRIGFRMRDELTPPYRLAHPISL